MRFVIFRRAAVALLAVSGAVTAGVLPAVSAGAATSGPVCSYQVNSDWGTGFTVQVSITNNGPALSGWTLQYAYAGNQQLTNGWNGTWSESGQSVTVTNASWNGTLATGASTTAGAQFSYRGTNTPPQVVTLNGTACYGAATASPSASGSASASASPSASGSAPPSGSASASASASPPPPGTPMATITSPASGSVIPVGSSVTVSATASIVGGVGLVDSVTFYATDYCSKAAVELGVASAAPYSVQWMNVPSGPFGISAVVATSRGLSAMSPAIPMSTTGGTTPPCGAAEPNGNPAVAIVAPSPNTIVNSDTTVSLTAVASSESGYPIDSITFYAVDTCGTTTTTVLGSVTSAPYTLHWVDPTPGNYTLTAVVNAGSAPVTSAPVQIAAGPNGFPPPCPTFPSASSSPSP
ncbi:cellulose binding domain-containing protein [Actinospica robiniae]|uniref:cellulose binding domain-containing protein n=1 Tax=Actinospica robiniae TaxID=304901 RepID=UPI0004134DC3|nr:cellulose binding domain-containing protein [Actinospica robiniae]